MPTCAPSKRAASSVSVSTTPRARTVASARRTFAPGPGEQGPTCLCPTGPPMHVSTAGSQPCLGLHHTHRWEPVLILSLDQCRMLSFPKGNGLLPCLGTQRNERGSGGCRGDVLAAGRGVVNLNDGQDGQDGMTTLGHHSARQSSGLALLSCRSAGCSLDPVSAC